MKGETVRVFRDSLMAFVDRKIKVGQTMPDGSRLLSIPMDDEVEYFPEGKLVRGMTQCVEERGGVRKSFYVMELDIFYRYEKKSQEAA